MTRRLALVTPLALACAALAQEAPGKLDSGPKSGTVLKTAFDTFNLNGPAKGRYHCLVCEYGLRPVALVFVRDHPKGADKAVEDLLGRLDKAVARDADGYLKSFAVFLSPAARSSATPQPKVTDPEALVAEWEARRALLGRLEPLAKKLTHVVVSTFPAEGPEGYNLKPEADVTVVLYVKHKVADTFAFPPGGLNDKAVEEIMKRVDVLAGRARPAGKEGRPAKGKGADKAASLRVRPALSGLYREAVRQRSPGSRSAPRDTGVQSPVINPERVVHGAPSRLVQPFQGWLRGASRFPRVRCATPGCVV
jgi:hypothetical protein